MSGLLQVVDASMTTASSRGSTTSKQRRVGNRRPDQPGTGLVDREPQVGDGVEIEVLERADGRHQGAQHGKVLQLGSHPKFDRPVAARAARCLVFATSAIVTSRKFRSDTTPGRFPANHRRSDHSDASACGNAPGWVILGHGECIRNTGNAEPADTRPLRRILITAGLVLAVLILIAVAIYAGAFIILAPMMQ